MWPASWPSTRAYHDDVYVDRELSLRTASQVAGLQVWVTEDYHHDGIGDDGPAIFRRLLAMANGEEPQAASNDD